MKLKPFFALLLLPVLGLTATPARADLIKQAATYTRTVLMTSSTDHITGATGLTLVIKSAKAGGVPATITDTVTEQGSGRYAIALTTTDTNTLGALDLIITATGADPSDTHDQVIAFDPNDASLLGLTGVATATTQGTQGTTLAAVKADTGSLVTSVGLLPSVASFLSGMKADALLAKTFNRPSGKYAYNLTTHVMTLQNDDNTTMGTVTLTYDVPSGTITGKQ